MTSLAPLDALVVRTWNDTPITRRAFDGYVNATAMCKANGKRWNNYFETDRATSYIETLSSVTAIPVTGFDGLVQTRQGGVDQGTWIHPRVAIDLARWISPEFAVWMDGWFLEELEKQAQPQPPAPQPSLAGTDVLQMLKGTVDFMRDLGCFEDRDRILFSDLARNNAMRVNSDFLLPPGDEEMTISDAYLELFQKRLSRDKSSQVGKLVAGKYREEFNQEPPTRIQYVDGAPRKVKSYKKNWLLNVLKLLAE
jgi:hypothetical protein